MCLRNAEMIERITAAPAKYPIRFAFFGGQWRVPPACWRSDFWCAVEADQ